MEKLKECVSIYIHTMEQENPFYTRKHCEIKRITNVPDRATARRGRAQLVKNKIIVHFTCVYILYFVHACVYIHAHTLYRVYIQVCTLWTI
jgi:hypothetical protein